MIFVGLIKTLSDGDSQAFRARLTTISRSSPIGRQIEANMMLEGKLPEIAARAILEGLLAQPNEAEALRLGFEQLCEANVLSGPEMTGTRPQMLGRAVVLDAFCAFLVKSHGFRTVRQAQAWVKRLCRLDVRALREALADLPIGGRVVWATFLEPKRESDPFLPLPASPGPLHDALGLDPKSRGRSLLLFVYAPTSDLALRFPTIADARWGRLFRPVSNNARSECGLTAPPTDDPAILPVPEIVHSTVNGDVLVDTLRILR